MEDSSYHFIGIGGIGMSGLARILLQRSKKVSGSDKALSSLTKDLVKEGAEIFLGHEASQVPLQSIVVYSSGIQKENVEYMEAKKRGLPLLHRSDLLQKLMKGSLPLLVTGTHGKTTTSSILAHVLAFVGESPSYCVGGIVQNFQSQSGSGKGKWFVAEADESDGSFLAYSPKGAIITNIDTDHLDYWKTEEKLVLGFVDFQRKVENKELCFWCADDKTLASLALDGISYGFSLSADLRIEKATYIGWRSLFDIRFKGVLYEDVEIPLIGSHNVLNAAAVFGLCLQIGIDKESLYKAMGCFLGAGRRAEKKGEVVGVSIYDDYAHHPTEIATTLLAMKSASRGSRLIVLFQPHRFTRTQDCFDLFGPALAVADVIFLTDVYGAGESPVEGIDSVRLVDKIRSQGYSQCQYVSRDELVEEVVDCLQPGDVVVSMGAGDITHTGPELLERLSLWA